MSIGVHYLIENVQLEGIPSSTNVDVVLSNSAYIDVTYSEPLANTLYIVSADSLQVGVSFTQPTAESVPIVYNATADSLQVGVTFSEPTAVSVAAGINYDTNLIAYYNFQNDTLDRTGNFNGTPSEAMAYAPSVVNQGGVFNGSRYVTLPSNILLSKSQFTISLWAKVNNNTQQRPIGFNDSGSGAPYIVIEFNTEATENRMYVWVYDGGTSSKLILNDIILTNLNHFVIVVDLNNNYKFYVNKILKGTIIIGAPVQVATFANIIGAARSGEVALNGSQDEVGIWGELFDQAKVNDLYDQQLAGNNIF